MTRPGSIPVGGRSPVSAIALVVMLIGHLGCREPGPETSNDAKISPFGSEGDWAVIYTDSAVAVALDTATVESREPNEYLVRYQTRWAVPRETQAPSPFNRELIRSLLRCEPTAFKTLEVSVYLNNGPLVARQGGDDANTTAAPWKEPQGAVDVPSLNRACEIITARRDQAR